MRAARFSFVRSLLYPGSNQRAKFDKGGDRREVYHMGRPFSAMAAGRAMLLVSTLSAQVHGLTCDATTEVTDDLFKTGTVVTDQAKGARW